MERRISKPNRGWLHLPSKSSVAVVILFLTPQSLSLLLLFVIKKPLHHQARSRLPRTSVDEETGDAEKCPPKQTGGAWRNHCSCSDDYPPRPAHPIHLIASWRTFNCLETEVLHLHLPISCDCFGSIRISCLESRATRNSVVILLPFPNSLGEAERVGPTGSRGAIVRQPHC